LSSNQLEKLPPSMANLEKLTHLDLSYNRFSEIPLSISALSSLQSLNFQGNKLTRVPPSAFDLPNLEFFDLRENLVPEDEKEALRAKMPKVKDLLLTEADSWRNARPVIYCWFVEDNGAGGSGYAVMDASLAKPLRPGERLYHTLDEVRQSLKYQEGNIPIVIPKRPNCVPECWKVRSLTANEAAQLEDSARSRQ